jgi:hypothetical protein
MRNVKNLLHVAQVLWIALICLAQKVLIPSLRDLKLSKSAPNKSGHLSRQRLLGFNAILVNPKGTTNSEYHDR